MLFVLIVVVVTLVQVLAVPIAAMIAGHGEWPLAVPEPVGYGILVVGCAAQAASLLLSDRWPQWSVVAVTAIYLTLAIGLGAPTWLRGMHLVIALALFLLASRSSIATSVLWLAAVVVVSVTVLFAWVLSIGTNVTLAVGFVAAEAVNLAAPSIGATALGLWWAAQTRRVTLAREQAELARQEHDRRVAEAQGRERVRIAQELHDVAGQHLAGLVTLANAALTLAPDRPRDALQLLEDVRDEGRFAAASLAGALSDLRAVGTEPLETTHDLRRIGDLISYWRQRGMEVRLAASGEIGDLPAIVSTTAYRALQEALTNAAKHAPGASVDVEITHVPGRLSVLVENHRSLGGARPVAGLGLGWGIDTVRERIDLLQGTLTTGPTSEGGWTLSFQIPVAPTE